MPQLPCQVLLALRFIQFIFERGVAAAKLSLEFELIGDGTEVEWITGAEDDSLFREVAIVRVVETI